MCLQLALQTSRYCGIWTLHFPSVLLQRGSGLTPSGQRGRRQPAAASRPGRAPPRSSPAGSIGRACGPRAPQKSPGRPPGGSGVKKRLRAPRGRALPCGASGPGAAPGGIEGRRCGGAACEGAGPAELVQAGGGGSLGVLAPKCPPVQRDSLVVAKERV